MNRRIRNKLKERKEIKRKNKDTENKLFPNKPQVKGLILKVYTRTPKKPNSALRKVALVRLKDNYKTYKEIECYIPTENHKLGNNNVILVIPKRMKDVPRLKNRLVKNVLDFKLNK